MKGVRRRVWCWGGEKTIIIMKNYIIYFLFLFPCTPLLRAMGKEIIPEIRDDYATYTVLVKDTKIAVDKIISITKSNNNANYIENNTDVKHISLPKEIVLIVTVKINNHKYFQFKLRCEELYKKPFFRFDSDGPTHRNYDDNIRLEEQQVTTPHFNWYDANGLNIAYKTDKLLDEKERLALEDIDLCLAHYCHEANIRCIDDTFPEVLLETGELPLDMPPIDDPNANIQFS